MQGQRFDKGGRGIREICISIRAEQYTKSNKNIDDERTGMSTFLN